MEANWPIRVGGEYQSRANKNIWYKVTEIVGDKIFCEGWYHGEKEPWVCDTWDHQLFRALNAPEDQSPIPALIAALQAVKSDPNPLTEAVSAQVEAALALVGVSA